MDSPACERHPETNAVATCSRCGSYACHDCLVSLFRHVPLCGVCNAALTQSDGRGVIKSARAVRYVAYTFSASAVVTAGGSLVGDGLGAVALTGVAIFFPALAVLAVAFVVWFRRANRALRRRGLSLEHGPNAWAWLFVPLANLYFPYNAVRELGESAAGYRGAVRVLPWWWGSGLLGTVVLPQFSPVTGPFTLIDAAAVVCVGVCALLLARVVAATTALIWAPVVQREGMTPTESRC